MGISIYYDAERDYPLTDEENNLIEKIIKKYNLEKSIKFKKGEDFYIYDKDEPEKIFSGSTGLVMSIINPMITAKCCMFWAKCLTEIRNIVKDANWYVHMDDDELIWDENNGWHLPGMVWDDKKGWKLYKIKIGYKK